MDILMDLAAFCTIAGFVLNTISRSIRIIRRTKGEVKQDDAQK